MCRNIKVLRESTRIAGPDQIEEAARQYVRKVSGFAHPAPANRAAFDRAVAEIGAATARLLGEITIGGRPTVTHR